MSSSTSNSASQEPAAKSMRGSDTESDDVAEVANSIDNTSTSVANLDKFDRFFDLPAEIRILIYEIALGGRTFSFHGRRLIAYLGGTVYSYRTGDEADFRLFRACKQIYQEARMIPYTSNVFDFKDHIWERALEFFNKRDGWQRDVETMGNVILRK